MRICEIAIVNNKPKNECDNDDEYLKKISIAFDIAKSEYINTYQRYKDIDVKLNTSLLLSISTMSCLAAMGFFENLTPISYIPVILIFLLSLVSLIVAYIPVNISVPDIRELTKKTTYKQELSLLISQYVVCYDECINKLMKIIKRKSISIWLSELLFIIDLILIIICKYL